MPHDHGPVLQYESNVTLTLSTLAALAAVKASSMIDTSRAQGFHLIWVKMAGYLAGKTAGEGPIHFGLLCNLSAVDIAAILVDDPQNAQVPTKMGPGSWYYPIMLFGEDELEDDINGTQGATNVQAQSKFTKYPVKWTIPEGNNFGYYAFNEDSGALTTGATIKVSAQYFGAWLRD